MKGLLDNQRGNIALSMVLVMVTFMSAISLSMLAFTDVIGTRLDFDALQEVLFLRSEAARGHAIVQLMDYDGEGFYLPAKNITVTGSHSKSTYNLRSRVMQENISTGGGFYFTKGYNIKSLIKARRGAYYQIMTPALASMVSRYGEKAIRRNSFAGYHYFTDTDQSTNGTPVYFWGPDVINGRVHSNTDIWIEQAGGGSNGGWPRFNAVVTTSGVIHSLSGVPPYDQVFRKGYFEHTGELEFNPQATEIRSHGTLVGPMAYDPNRIVMITMAGNSYTMNIGLVQNIQVDTADVWTNYPPPDGQYLYHNRYNRYDTLWTPGSGGTLSGHSYFVNSKLWLRGSFAGKQTWCSSDTLFLIGSCTLAGTQVGMSPDGGEDGSQPINRNDFLGLVSEKSIIVKYGFKDPFSGNRLKPNCGSDAQGIWIYAAMCALGDGEGNPHKDGVFSFEYQHPHPATPDQEVNGVPYTKIDLHLHRYPPTQTQPWPANLDLPWYNPLWPESYGYMERGTIHLYGSVAQRRRGFVHRNTSDGDYPNPNGAWNVPIDFCGGASYPSGNAYNAPGATGSGVGYKKDYHFDNRFSFTDPPDFPEVHLRGGYTPFESEIWTLKRPPRDI